MRSTLTVAVMLLVAAPASAQTTVSAVITGDVARFSRVEADGTIVGGFEPDTFDGEAIGFTIGLTRAIGQRWGVGVEVGRTGEIESVQSRNFDLRVASSLTIGTLSPIRPIDTPGTGTRVPPTGSILPAPDFAFDSRNELQQTTISALAWVKHDAGDRVELSYAGGLTFIRSESERSISITDPRLAQWTFPAGLRQIEYRAAPTVGADAAIEFTDHTALTVGVRLHAISVSGLNGWLVRPSAGVRWTF